MKKVGLVTIHRAYNYGAVLQAYALSKIIKDFSYNCEIIDYNSYDHEKIYSRDDKSWYLRMKRPLYDKLRCDRFENFITGLPLSEKKYHSIKEFSELQNYDILVAGSDQIWNI